MLNRDASMHNYWPSISPGSELPHCESAADNVENVFDIPAKHITTLPFPMALGSAQGGDKQQSSRRGGGCVCCTWLSSPKKISMRKKRQDQS